MLITCDFNQGHMKPLPLTPPLQWRGPPKDGLAEARDWGGEVFI
jgi:hypothetical protein